MGRISGVNYDTSGESNYLEFLMCEVPRPIVAPVATKGDDGAKKKRHSCGKGAMELVMGATTAAAATAFLF